MRLCGSLRKDNLRTNPPNVNGQEDSGSAAVLQGNGYVGSVRTPPACFRRALPQKSERLTSSTFLFTPGFSPVTGAHFRSRNRFNGFSVLVGKEDETVKTVARNLFPAPITGSGPVNEMLNCQTFEAKPIHLKLIDSVEHAGGVRTEVSC